MVTAIIRPVRTTLELIHDNFNVVSNTALLRCLSNFRRNHPLLFWLLSPMIVPAVSFLAFWSSVILFGIVFLVMFYGILFLMFFPTLLVVLSGPTALAVFITCTCYVFYGGFLSVQACLRFAKRAPELARQFYTSAQERIVWFLGMENGGLYTGQHWITLRNELLIRSLILWDNLARFPQAARSEGYFRENCQRVTEKIEQTSRMYQQAVAFYTGVLAFPRQVIHAIMNNRVVFAVVVLIRFVLGFPRQLKDKMVCVYRQTVSMTHFHQPYQTTSAVIVRITSIVATAVQLLLSFPRRWKDWIMSLYRQAVTIWVQVIHQPYQTISAVIARITSIIATAVYFLLSFPRLLKAWIMSLRRQAVAIRIQVHLLYQTISATICKCVSIIVTAIYFILSIPQRIKCTIISVYRQVLSFCIQVRQLYQTTAAKICVIISIIVTAIRFILGIPRLIKDRIMSAYKQVVCLCIKVYQLYQTTAAKICVIISIIVTAIRFILGIPRRIKDRIMSAHRQVVSFCIEVYQLYQTIAAKTECSYRFIISIILTLHQFTSFFVSIPQQVKTFFTEKSLKERIEEKIRELERKIDQKTNEVEGRVRQVIQETRNTNIIVNITNPLLPAAHGFREGETPASLQNNATASLEPRK